jgi:hypothetical protein
LGGGIASTLIDAITSAVTAATSNAGQMQNLEANLTGEVTLTGDVHLDLPGFREAIGRLIAQGIARATGGATGANVGGARPDFTCGVILQPPT